MKPARRTPRSRVRRAVPGLAGLVGALLLAAGLAPASGIGAARADDKGKAGPLAVRITSLSPTTVPRKGPVRISGVVTNTSSEAWQAINVHAFVSTSPITSAAELDKAAAQPYDADVGDRLLSDHAFVAIGDLPPGKSTDFSLRIPRSELPIPNRPGVYWVGVHALGANKLGRDGVADGRARTFIPLYRATTPKSDVTLVVPFRAKVRRDHTGTLRDPKRWQRLLADDGRLERVLGVTESAGSTPVTLVLDPAVLDAVNSLTGGTTTPTAGGTGPSPSASPSASSDSGGTGSDGTSSDTTTSDDPKVARAQEWLRRLTAVADTKSVLGLGYADPDVAALGALSPDLLNTSYTLAKGTFASYQVDAQPAVVPPDGYLPTSAFTALGTDARLLVSDHGTPVRRTSWQTGSGQQLIFGNSGAASGGPGPSDPLAALALRQRIVSEAALRAMSGTRAPLVVTLPADWDPGPDWEQADLFTALEQPWLRLSGLPSMAPATPIRSRLAYPTAEQKNELGRGMVVAAERAVAAAQVYADALTRPDGAVDGYTRLALQTTSYHARVDRGLARLEAVDLRNSITSQLRGIRVVGSSFVTMSGGSGTFVVTLVNDLDQRVRVGLSAQTSSSKLSIAPHEAVTLLPKQRTTVRLSATSSGIGVREATLTPITSNGAAIGTPISFSVRSSQVGILIWAIMGAGVALLVVMIARRWIKRGLSRRSPAQ